MSKLNYKTSKDYKRLKELLDQGREVIIIHEHESLTGNKVVSACDMARFEKGKTKRFDGYNFGFTGVFRRDFSRFEKICAFWGIEFIEPNGED